jgi:hypothetical protein
MANVSRLRCGTSRGRWTGFSAETVGRTTTIRELSSEVDVIVLAQASMARVLDTIPDDKRSVEILSSPRMAVEQARRLLLS